MSGCVHTNHLTGTTTAHDWQGGKVTSNKWTGQVTASNHQGTYTANKYTGQYKAEGFNGKVEGNHHTGKATKTLSRVHAILRTAKFPRTG